MHIRRCVAEVRQRDFLKPLLLSLCVSFSPPALFEVESLMFVFVFLHEVLIPGEVLNQRYSSSDAFTKCFRQRLALPSMVSSNMSFSASDMVSRTKKERQAARRNYKERRRWHHGQRLGQNGYGDVIPAWRVM